MAKTISLTDAIVAQNCAMTMTKRTPIEGANLDDLTEAGSYSIANSVTSIPGMSTQYGACLVFATDRRTIQMFISDYSTKLALRMKIGDSWKPFMVFTGTTVTS